MKCCKSLVILLCLLCMRISAQQLGTWRMYLSYQIATKSVYALMNGNLLSYDTEDGEVRVYDHMGILSDVRIADIAYSEEAGSLLIVYSNCNVDILDRDGVIHNLSALKDKRILGKEVVDVCINGTMAFLATGFGIVEIDLRECVFRNTYKLSYSISCISATDEAVFIGSPDGIRYCMRSANMQLEENWRMRLNWGGFKRLCVYEGKLIAMNPDGVFVLEPYLMSQHRCSLRKNYTYLKVVGKELLWWNKSELGCLSDLDESATTVSLPNIWSDIIYTGGTYWMSEQENGLCAYKRKEGEIIPTGEVIQPSSPIRDLGYKVNWVGDRLLVAGGVNTVDAFINPATAMYYENGEWTNFKEMEIPAEYPSFRLVNTTDLVQDPSDATHHFASLYRGGLCEYRNGKFVKLYNHDNSPLRSLIPAFRDYYNYVFCSALSYDKEGNLWMASSMRDTVLSVLKPDGTWYKLYYDDLNGCSLVDQILHHSSGIKFITSRRLEKRGIFCLDTKGTQRNTDDRYFMHQNIINQDETPYLPDQFYCLCEDLDGQVWVGTSAGLFVIEDVSQVFDQNYRFTQIKINRNDGSGLADYLLNDVSISCIAIDAATRKWIGTQTNGAYLISADGQEMIYHFTTDDSPLLSNNVQSISVNSQTGEVVFGTDKGLCSFIGDATAPEDELDKENILVFPNPVTPDYNGPIAIRGLVNDAEVKIVSTGGQLVWNGVSSGGTCLWNGCANNGQPVASGVYHVVCNTPDGKKAVVTRIVVVR